MASKNSDKKENYNTLDSDNFYSDYLNFNALLNPDDIYYLDFLTDDFPAIPRMFRGTPSVDFRLGG